MRASCSLLILLIETSVSWQPLPSSFVTRRRHTFGFPRALLPIVLSSSSDDGIEDDDEDEEKLEVFNKAVMDAAVELQHELDDAIKMSAADAESGNVTETNVLDSKNETVISKAQDDEAPKNLQAKSEEKEKVVHVKESKEDSQSIKKEITANKSEGKTIEKDMEKKSEIASEMREKDAVKESKEDAKKKETVVKLQDASESREFTTIKSEEVSDTIEKDTKSEEARKSKEKETIGRAKEDNQKKEVIKESKQESEAMKKEVTAIEQQHKEVSETIEKDTKSKVASETKAKETTERPKEDDQEKVAAEKKDETKVGSVADFEAFLDSDDEFFQLTEPQEPSKKAPMTTGMPPVMPTARKKKNETQQTETTSAFESFLNSDQGSFDSRAKVDETTEADVPMENSVIIPPEDAGVTDSVRQYIQENANEETRERMEKLKEERDREEQKLLAIQLDKDEEEEREQKAKAERSKQEALAQAENVESKNVTKGKKPALGGLVRKGSLLAVAALVVVVGKRVVGSFISRGML